METKFIQYLNKEGFRPQTIYGYVNKIKEYFRWCSENGYNRDEITLDDLYEYKKYCLERGCSLHTTRQLVGVTKHYFASIGREDNPTLFIKHKRQDRTLPKALLNSSELTEIYFSSMSKTIIGRRNKVMLGMLIYQGLKKEEVTNIEVGHIDLDTATVYIQSTSITNARTIELHSVQMNDLMSYVYEYRPLLLNEVGKQTDRLFFSMGKGSILTNALYIMLKEIKKTFPAFRTITQIRESRMSIWVQEHGIRKAQYLSGIKYTSSMLRYQTADIDKLHKKLAVAHPMERLNMLKNVTK